MRIDKIIKEKRKELGFTQEEVAQYLGVSAPAVNKWENGNTYPDIMLLPALARLLKTDLNTLLSYNEDLSEQEIIIFMNEFLETLHKKGFKVGYEMGMKKIQEYPNSDKLINRIAMSLEGAMIMLGVDNKDEYEDQIEKLYERTVNSSDADISNSSKSMMISKYIKREEFEKAQELINSLPSIDPNKRSFQSDLYFKQGKTHEAARLLEIQLRNYAIIMYVNLKKMMQISLKENDEKNAKYYVDIASETARLYDLGEYSAYMAEVELYAYNKDDVKTIDTIKKVMDLLPKMTETYQSKLYSHIFQNSAKKTEENKESLVNSIKVSILKAMKKDEEFTFLKDNKEFKKLLKDYNMN